VRIAAQFESFCALKNPFLGFKACVEGVGLFKQDRRAHRLNAKSAIGKFNDIQSDHIQFPRDMWETPQLSQGFFAGHAKPAANPYRFCRV